MTTGASGSSGDQSPSKKKGWPKGKKRRLMPKDANAPKGPLSGYMLFMNDQREILKQSQSRAGFLEVTKIVSHKWAQLERPEKQKYLDAAEIDKERYQQEFEKYQKTDVYIKYINQQMKDSKRPKKDVPSIPKQQIQEEIPFEKYNSLEIPIFTEEFLNHNKGREAELRQLRKSNTEYEEQNAILQKHIETVRAAVEKLEESTSKQQSNNNALKQHLKSLRKTLTQALISIPIPGSNETPKEDTIDSYVTRLHTVLTSNPSQHQKLVNTVKTIINNITTN